MTYAAVAQRATSGMSIRRNSQPIRYSPLRIVARVPSTTEAATATRRRTCGRTSGSTDPTRSPLTIGNSSFT